VSSNKLDWDWIGNLQQKVFMPRSATSLNTFSSLLQLSEELICAPFI